MNPVAGRVRHREDGSASIWVLASGLGLAALACVPALTGVAAIDRDRASVAADLSALAAFRVARGPGESINDGCRAAAVLAGLNGARVLECAAVGCTGVASQGVASVQVRVAVAAGSLLADVDPVVADAEGVSRAGLPACADT